MELKKELIERKQRKEKIKELLKEEKYDEVFADFGRDIYIKYAPKEYKYQDLEKLEKERKYEQIYNKYGEEMYNSILFDAMYNEIKETRGIKEAIPFKIKGILKKCIRKLCLTIGFTAYGIGVATTLNEVTIKDNSIKYEKEIKDYNDKIEDYAKEVNSMKYDDTKIFMKVIDDMWESTKGYAEPEKDIYGFWELDLATEDGYGVCRNMASDVAKKLNKIDSKYNARTVNALTEKYKYSILGNIDENTQNFVKNIVGDHRVVLADIPNDNLIVMIDPTWKKLGICQDGKIIVFYSEDCNIIFEIKELSMIISNGIGYEELINIPLDYVKSFEKPNLTFEEIEHKYGAKAQKESLKEVRNKSKIKKAKINNKEEFRERVRVENNKEVEEKKEIYETNLDDLTNYSEIQK